MEQEELAKLLYDNYCEGVGGVAFNGLPLPKSAEFFADATKQKQADAWRKVAAAALIAIPSVVNIQTNTGTINF